MATYYYQGSSDFDRRQIQTLHLMNPNYVTSSDGTQNHHQDNTLLFMADHHHDQFVGFTVLSSDPSRPSLLHHQDQEDHVHNNNIPRNLYNHPTLELLAHHGNQANTAQIVSPQCLSSLSPCSHKVNAEAFQKSNTNCSNGQDLQEDTRINSSDDNYSSLQGVILGSKYLKATQELLDEVASVVGNNKDDEISFNDAKDKAAKNVKIKQPSNDETGAARDELTTAQIQELQMKKAKLNSMLHEVKERCRHYHREMQITISLFEGEAGMGSSRSYTELAFKTILKQFKRLKYTIISQIRSINKTLGDELHFEGSGLKFIDHHQLRERKSSSQQLSMMQNNAWRPQRGLPETAVSVLRAWLFEHFLHPYPKDSDKSMMAKQTGLTRNQVSNWFINARVRLWKPMVEEMYLEEMKNQEMQVMNDHKCKSSSPSPSEKNNVKQSHHHHENPTSSLVPSPMAEISASSLPKIPENIEDNIKRKRRNQENSPSSILPSVEMDVKDHNNVTMKGFRGNHLHHHQDYLSSMNINHHHGNYYSQGSSFGNYGIGEISRFNTEHDHFQANDNNNGSFSLSLALPPPSSVNYGISSSSHRDHIVEFVNGGTGGDHGAMNGDDGSSNPRVPLNYELLDFYKRKRYASHQMLPPDFVA